jgi:Glycosyl transferase family 2
MRGAQGREDDPAASFAALTKERSVMRGAVKAQAPLSVCIITRNEERNLPRCLKSVDGLAAEIVVVDSLSEDRTCEIAKDAGAVVRRQGFLGYERQKQLALEMATGEWILCLDADEWLDTRLREAIAGVLRNPASEVNGYRVNRRQYYLGRWMDHGGWSPEWKLRMVRRGCGRWTGGDPHERLEATGATRRLPGRLHHFPHRDLSAQIATINGYSSLAVANRPPVALPRALFGILLEPPLVFLKEYLLLRGCLDGRRGFIAAVMASFHTFLKYAKHWERG